ncbi:MAG: DUF427 domain-containing protein [Alphaproteobacteria bacterium]|nr:DUF427 domain-containing protein [Alphaproteobacteria bacterium]
MKAMKEPTPDHPIIISPSTERVVVKLAGEVIAETRRSLKMQESSYPPVYYIPREDAAMDKLARTDHLTFCPYKGDAGYFSIAANGTTADNAVWTYEAPFPAVAEIKGYLAFYPSKVDAIEVTPA